MRQPISSKNMKDAIIVSQHTQRNWDLSKQIPEEDIEVLMQAVTECPSKQNFAFYKAHFITNRDIIERIHEASTGLGYLDENGERIECTNPQTLANLLIAFEPIEPSEEFRQKWKDRDFSNDETFKRDVDMAVGIAAGYLNLSSSLMGYRSGCCACYKTEEVRDIIGAERDPVLLMGIGYHDETRQRREHHTIGVKIPRRVKEKIDVNFVR